MGFFQCGKRGVFWYLQLEQFLFFGARGLCRSCGISWWIRSMMQCSPCWHPKWIPLAEKHSKWLPQLVFVKNDFCWKKFCSGTFPCMFIFYSSLFSRHSSCPTKTGFRYWTALIGRRVYAVRCLRLAVVQLAQWNHNSNRVISHFFISLWECFIYLVQSLILVFNSNRYNMRLPL